jgi:hypothetical protein
LDKIVKGHLWDEINTHFLHKALFMYNEDDHEYSFDEDCKSHAFYFYFSLQRDFFGQSIDDFASEVSHINQNIKNIVMNTSWYNTLDVIEAICRLSPILIPNTKDRKGRLKKFYKEVNAVFDEEKCTYRIINGLVVPKVNDAEVIAIATALTDTISIKTVNIHLDQAIRHYADRKNSDYRNAIKESILALESLIKIISKSKNGTLEDALKAIRKNNVMTIHPALQKSLTSLYGWAGDESGIRHSLKGDSIIDDNDARLIITTCCSYVSFLVSKAIQSGITF